MSFSEIISLPEVEKCISFKTLSQRNLEIYLFEKLKKVEAETVSKLDLISQKIVFVPFVQIQYELECDYSYEAVDTQREPYTEYVRLGNSPAGTDRVEPRTKWRTIEVNPRTINGSDTINFYKSDLAISINKYLNLNLIHSKFTNRKEFHDKFLTEYKNKLQFFNINSSNIKNLKSEVNQWMDVYTNSNKDLLEFYILDNDINSVKNQLNKSEMKDFAFNAIKRSDQQGNRNRNYRMSYVSDFIGTKTIYIPYLIQEYNLENKNEFLIVSNLLEEEKSVNKKNNKKGAFVLYKSKTNLKERGYNFFRDYYLSPLKIFLSISILGILLKFIIYAGLAEIVSKIITNENNTAGAITTLIFGVRNQIKFTQWNFSSTYSSFFFITGIGSLLLIYNWLYQAIKEKNKNITEIKEIIKLKTTNIVQSSIRNILSGIDMKVNSNIIPSIKFEERKTLIMGKIFNTNYLLNYFGISIISLELIYSIFNKYIFLFLFLLWIVLTILYPKYQNNSYVLGKINELNNLKKLSRIKILSIFNSCKLRLKTFKSKINKVIANFYSKFIKEKLKPVSKLTNKISNNFKTFNSFAKDFGVKYKTFSDKFINKIKNFYK